MRYNLFLKGWLYMNDSVLAKRLKTLRQEKGYLQKFVADKIGVKSNTLSGYENGTRTPEPNMIKELANVYGVTTDYLLGRTDILGWPPEFEEYIEGDLEAFIGNVKIWDKNNPESRDELLKMMEKMFQQVGDD